MSLSKVARGKVMVANQQNEKIPEGWAIDKEGKPTTDAKESSWRVQCFQLEMPKEALLRLW